MQVLLTLINLAASIVSLVCFILVLLKLFPDKGVGWGIFGIFCGIYTFIWGWQNADRHNLKNIMTLWSAAFVANILLQIVVVSITGSSVD
ncbi:hypothetical protein [Leptolyngbya sp. FACHB-17]|uniref:hypothetical protein n=1 Tax=unclassified Leptolyngbya TaxID=2650499 RepID=UPI001680CD9A|nr:hypothetical protein [Leptolyngbya sp. FACHB-17]MBD2079207.1 hypothetical protein [Leptolyngbya sp. FACHB-17]